MNKYYKCWHCEEFYEECGDREICEDCEQKERNAS